MMDSFVVQISFQGKTAELPNVTVETTAAALYIATRHALEFDAASSLKLLYKGKRLDPTDDNKAVFPKIPTKMPKLLVMATSASQQDEQKQMRSDPTIRGFEQEAKRHANKEQNTKVNPYWGTTQDRQYRFVKLEACTWQSFGHRPTDGTTPHAFEAFQLLERLATDPGIVAIMQDRQLVVNTLGEMDPIDDRLMQKTAAASAGNSHLLGYNTNHGLRIDIKLRTDDLKSFRPYPSLVETLIHELSHNWVGDHNYLFWSNYGQMRATYLMKHAPSIGSATTISNSAQKAGLQNNPHLFTNMAESLFQELAREMQPHGLTPGPITGPIQAHLQDLQQARQEQWRKSGQTLGSSAAASNNGAVTATGLGKTARERALEAAEQRRAAAQQHEQQQHQEEGAKRKNEPR